MGAGGERQAPVRHPRIAPGGPAEIGRLNHGLARLVGVGMGGGPPHLFTTLARHRRLFRRWMRFAAALMPGGVLPRADTELVILRVAHTTRCEYERLHHYRLAKLAGLDAEQIAAVGDGSGPDLWTERQRLLLDATDELLGERTISEPLWVRLRAELTDEELIELCLLVGHYEMLAMTLNALAVEPDRLPSDSPPRLARLLARAARRFAATRERR